MSQLKTVFAYTMLGDDGVEVIPTFLDEQTNVVTPLLATTQDKAIGMRRTAQLISSTLGRPLRFVRFSRVSEGETIEPEKLPEVFRTLDTPDDQGPRILVPGDPGFNDKPQKG